MLMLKQLAASKKCSQEDIAIILKTQQSEVSKMMNGHRKITDEHIDMLIEHFGKDVVDEYIVDDDIIDLTKTPQARQVQATIIPAEIVEEAKAEAAEEAIKEFIEEISIPIVPSEIVNKTNVNIRQFIEKKGPNLKQFNPQEFTNGSIGAKRILDSSMWPTFSPGDFVFFAFLPDKRMLTDGKTYLFDLNERPAMVRKVKIEGDKLRLIAENPEYGDIVTSFDQVFNIADITGMFRYFFGDQHSKIEALRRHKEEQIDTLVQELRDSGRRTDHMMNQTLELMQKLMEKLL